MRRVMRPRGFVIGLAVLSAAAPLAQQRPADSDIARQLADAERLEHEHKLDEAVTAFLAIVDIARAAGLPAEEAQAKCGLGETLDVRTEYSRAAPVLQDCLAIAERMHSDAGILRATTALSQNADLTGRHKEAIAFAQRAVDTADRMGDPRKQAWSKLQLAHVGRLPLDEEQALSEQIIAEARAAGDPALEATALHAFGDVLYNSSQFERAFEMLTRARELYHQAGAYANEGTALNSIGRVYRAHGRLDEALKCQLQALALHQKYGSPFELMQSHNAVAVVEQFSGNVTASREHFESALAIARQTSSPRIQDFLNANIASLLIGLGEYEKAARTLEDVIARGLDTNTTVRYGNLALAYVKLNRPADAVDAANHALASCGDDSYSCIDALDNRALAYAALNDLPAARADLRQAVDKIEHLRSTLVPADRLKQNFQDAQRGIYSASIALAFRQHDVRNSLDTAELASSRAFLDLLEGRRGQSNPSGDDSTIVLRGGSTDTSRDMVSRSNAAPAHSDDLVAIAQRLHSTLVEYWPGDDGLFIWVVKRDGTIVEREAPDSSARLLEWIRAASPSSAAPGQLDRSAAGAVTTRGASQFALGDPTARRAWRQLYDGLIAPIRDQLPAAPGSLLTIVPHGVTMAVSFAALQTRNGRYLLEDYALNYAPAGAVLQFTAQHRIPDARSGRVLLVADPATVRPSPLDPALPPLPGARTEAARIAALLPRQRVTMLEGAVASEPRVRSEVERKAIVHFATHAIVRDDDPNASYLAFSPAGGEKRSTGLVTARDIYDLRLTADLVVLSACRSGGGRVTGDGIAAFARAFVYAGAPSLVVSLWDVADGPTGRLLPAFYRSWLAGASKARSLRRAQLQLLADLRAGTVTVETKAGPVVLPEDPMFWAGFVLIGEPQ